MGFGWVLDFNSFPLCMFCLHVCEHTPCVQVPTEPEQVLDVLEWGLRMVVNCQEGAGTEPRSSERAVSDLNFFAVHPVPGAIGFFFFFSAKMLRKHTGDISLFNT